MKNKNNITEIIFILDRSGSMSGLESDTIGDFNSMIEKQKKQFAMSEQAHLLVRIGARISTLTTSAEAKRNNYF